MDLVLEGQEQNVGPFRADILCRNAGSSDHWVLVENQIARTDHSHLGQLLTYAAGLHAVTIVWIAAKFTDEHRAALNWLNDVTLEGVSFFGLEIELWRIGDSVPAPKFNVVSKPNEWVKQGEQAKGTTTSLNGNFYTDYWRAFSDFAVGKHSVFGTPRKSNLNWIAWSAGRGIAYTALISRPQKYIRVRMTMGGSRGKKNYQDLANFRDQIDSNLPNLDWRERPDNVESYIDLTLHSTDPDDRENWSKQHDWMLRNLSALQAAFEPVIKMLP